MKHGRILVTGAGGNLARQIIGRLVSAGGVAVLATDIKEPDEIERDVEFEQLDIVDTERVGSLVKKFRPSLVIHMASLLSMSSERDPQVAWNINATASVRLIHLAMQNGVRQLFYPSTGATYGGSLPDTLPEDYPQWPDTIYGATKVAVERAGSYYHAKHGFDFRSLRLPMVISPYAPDAAVSAYASHAYRAAVIGENFVFPVGPDACISTIYVEDVIDGIVRFLDADSEALTRRVYNIHAFSPTAHDIAESITRAAPSLGIPRFGYDFRPDRRVTAVIDVLPSVHVDESARRDWGWQPRFDLDATTRHMLSRLAAAADSASGRARR